jgi:hypothetical protein
LVGALRALRPPAGDPAAIAEAWRQWQSFAAIHLVPATAPRPFGAWRGTDEFERPVRSDQVRMIAPYSQEHNVDEISGQPDSDREPSQVSGDAAE